VKVGHDRASLRSFWGKRKLGEEARGLLSFSERTLPRFSNYNKESKIWGVGGEALINFRKQKKQVDMEGQKKIWPGV